MKVKSEEKYLSDEEIIELYWARNEEAIKETDVKYGKYLFTIAYNIVHDRLDCEECLNDTYYKTWSVIPPSRPNALQVFLSRIMRNVAVDRYRKNSADRRVPCELVVSIDELGDSLICDPTLDEESAVSVLANALNGFLRELDDDEQFMFVCRYYYCDKIADIANLLKVSERTVFRTLADVRQRLKERLEKEGVQV